MISGFSIIRNGDQLGYPYAEALRSLAPLVDEIVVAMGDNDDSTHETLLKLADELNCPLKIISSPWDPTSMRGGLELSRQTNLALDHCQHDLCFYLQADEGLDENEYEILRRDLKKFADDPEVDALAFHWRHFYGNFSHVVANRKWYRKEARVIKKSSGLRSYGDAQGFRILQADGSWRKGRAALSSAHVNHYGWVRPPEKMIAKVNSFGKLWHGHQAPQVKSDQETYKKQFGLRRFKGKIPKFLAQRAAELESYVPWEGQKIRHWPEYLSLLGADLVERATGWRIGEFSNYRYVKKY